MKLSFGICFISLACRMLVAGPAPDALRILATAPLRFEPAAEGSPARFVARGVHFRYEFSPGQTVLHTGGKALRLRFEGATAQARIDGEEKLASKTNFYIGNDPSKWRTSVPNYGRIAVHGLYPGIDLLYYGNPGELEYDLTVKPDANPGQIRLRLKGGLTRLDREGNLISELIQKRPVAYQTDADGKRIPIHSRYRKNSDGTYGFALGPYDHRRDLVIDPVLTLAKYLAGSLQDIAYGIGHDAKGLLYVAGTTISTDFPAAGTPDQAALAGGYDLFLAVINPVNSALYYSSYFGGALNETFGGMSVGPKGDVYLTGATESANFPTVNPFQSALATTSTTTTTSTPTRTNAFVAWFDGSQILRYSSYIGGTGAADVGRAIAADSHGVLWVTGSTDSGDFPQLSPMQIYGGQQDMFVAGFDPSKSGASTLVYSSYLGGTGWDIGRGIAVASDGTLWVVGGTSSVDINVIGPCFQCNYQGGGDAYIAHLNPALGSKALVFATYLGGSNLEEAKNVLIDPAGRVVLSGYTTSLDFPVTSDALQPQFGGNADVFVSVFDPSIKSSSGELVYSTYFGGTDADVPFDMKQDANGFLYLSGFTFSSGLPSTAHALQPDYDGSMDAFALKIGLPSKTGTGGIGYFSYLGSDGLQVAYGVDFDVSGHMYLAGFTSGPIFGSLGGPNKSTNPGNVDAFVVGFNPAPATSSSHERVGPPIVRRW